MPSIIISRSSLLVVVKLGRQISLLFCHFIWTENLSRYKIQVVDDLLDCHLPCLHTESPIRVRSIDVAEKVEAKAKIVYDVCHFFYDRFRFRSV